MRIRELCFFGNGPLPSIEIRSKVEMLNAPFQGRNRQFLPHPSQIREPNPEESASHHMKRRRGHKGRGRAGPVVLRKSKNRYGPRIVKFGKTENSPEGIFEPSKCLLDASRKDPD